MLDSSSKLALVTTWLCCSILGGVQQAAAQDASMPSWRQECGQRHCFVSIAAPTENQGQNHGNRQREGIILGVDIDKATKSVRSVAIILPPDVIRGQEVTIGFVDLKLKQTEGGALYQLPINSCFDGGCAARVAPLLDNGDGTNFDLVQALQRNSFLWVLYQARGAKEPIRAFVPIHGLKGALNSVAFKADAPSN